MFGAEPGVLTGASPAVQHILNRAMAAYQDTKTAETLLAEAHALNPEQLDVYIALYKFYFYKKRLPEAEDWARMGLARSARQGRFAADWRELTPMSADWARPNSPERVYLYTLKALGFIRLRQLDIAGSEAILAKLQLLDPQDLVGGSVISGLVGRLKEGDDG